MKVLRPGTDTSVLGKAVRIRTPILGRLSRFDLNLTVLHPGTDTSVLGKGVSVLTFWRLSTDTSVLGKGTRPSTDTSVLGKGTRPSTDTSVLGKGVQVLTLRCWERVRVQVLTLRCWERECLQVLTLRCWERVSVSRRSLSLTALTLVMCCVESPDSCSTDIQWILQFCGAVDSSRMSWLTHCWTFTTAACVTN
jgi:hypothetical protein